MGTPEYALASPRGRWAGATLLALAAGSAVACVALLWAAQDNWLRLASAALCALVTLTAAYHGKRRRIPVLRDFEAVRSLMQRTGIPMALYLRRFAHDLAADHPPATEGDAGGSDEAQLAESFAGLCLFVAIGRPGEPLPPWGAYRLYVPDEAWQRQVAALISLASIAVVRVGHSTALQWELTQLREAGKLNRTLFLLPHGGTDWDPSTIVHGTPTAAQPPPPANTRYAAFLTLDADGRPRLHARNPALPYGESAKQVAAEALGLGPLGRSGRKAIRGFYGKAERLLDAVTVLSLYGFAGGLVVGMLLVLLLLLAALFPQGVDATLDLLGPILDPLLMAAGIVAAVSMGLLMLMAAMRERLLP